MMSKERASSRTTASECALNHVTPTGPPPARRTCGWGILGQSATPCQPPLFWRFALFRASIGIAAQAGHSRCWTPRAPPRSGQMPPIGQSAARLGACQAPAHCHQTAADQPHAAFAQPLARFSQTKTAPHCPCRITGIEAPTSPLHALVRQNQSLLQTDTCSFCAPPLQDARSSQLLLILYLRS